MAGPRGSGGRFTSYSIENDKEFDELLKKAKEVASDLTIPLTLIGQDFFDSRRAIFKLKSPGQYPDLGGFNPTEKVKGKTRRQLAKQRKQKAVGFVYPLLKRSGRLEDSITNPRSKDALLQVVDKVSLFVGTKVPYAIYHQSDQPRKVIPQRKMLFIGPESIKHAGGDSGKGQLERWNGIMKDYIVEATGKEI